MNYLIMTTMYNNFVILVRQLMHSNSKTIKDSLNFSQKPNFFVVLKFLHIHSEP